jgi:lysine N6-hydroxylase
MNYNCVGVGVGPSNLSLASLLDSYRGLRPIFFEKKPTFGWHEGMMVDGATLQVSLFKDLVTLADPTNRFSFLAYLHAEGKIYQFLNAQFDEIPRREYGNYLKWASARNDAISFNEEVASITFDGTFTVETSKRRVMAENICVGVGTEAFVPDFAVSHLDETQFHVSNFLHRIGNIRNKRVAVVGGGQSGAEAVLSLLNTGRGDEPAEVIWISRRDNFLPIDDSPFTNDFFMPCHSDYFFAADSGYRSRFIQRNVLASDGISERTLRDIYQRLYSLRFVDPGLPAVTLVPCRTVSGISREAGAWALAALHDGHSARETVRADIVVWATGFRPSRTDFLNPIAGRMEREEGEFRLDDDFAVKWDGPKDRSVFMFNAARRQRGLADPNLSLIAWRSERVIDRIRGVASRARRQHPSFVSWGPLGILAQTEVEAV